MIGGGGISGKIKASLKNDFWPHDRQNALLTETGNKRGEVVRGGEEFIGLKYSVWKNEFKVLLKYSDRVCMSKNIINTYVSFKILVK